MSKSLGNFATIASVLNAYDANTVRYFLLQHHYRSPVDFNDDALQGAKNRMATMHRVLHQAGQRVQSHPAANALLNERKTWDAARWLASEKSAALQTSSFQKLLMELCDDLNTPRALACLDQHITELSTRLSSQATPLEWVTDYALALALFTVLGFNEAGIHQSQVISPLLMEQLEQYALTLQQELNSPDVTSETMAGDPLEQILWIRRNAKQEKNWAMSDRIRDHLKTVGIQIMDRKDGQTDWEVV
jgi:cysteinyl-tRNA synthetase